jgi:hypothetical protein
MTARHFTHDDFARFILEELWGVASKFVSPT